MITHAVVSLATEYLDGPDPSRNESLFADFEQACSTAEPYELGEVLRLDRTLDLPREMVIGCYRRLIQVGADDARTLYCFANYLLLSGPDWDDEANEILARVTPALKPARMEGSWWLGHHPVFLANNSVDDVRAKQRAEVSDYLGTRKRAAALRLLSWNDTAVIEDAAALLIMNQDVDSMVLVCEALAIQDAAQDYEGNETILWELSPAWKSGAVDVPKLLKTVQQHGTDLAKQGAELALNWLRVDG